MPKENLEWLNKVNPKLRASAKECWLNAFRQLEDHAQIIKIQNEKRIVVKNGKIIGYQG